MQVTNIHEAKTHLSRLVERVAEGEEIIIAKAGKPVAKLVPYKETLKPNRKPGSMKGKIWISRDFDKEDKEIEALFYEGPIEPPLRHPRSPVVARRKQKSVA
ncbi:MAG TPA: type II toxin-antitoxin system prevent-host-death family antitoxin [Bryobacteraceae bacterium]|nr:type II toxin-antitoxin system prevent-host-death family antitoxin [Bryobacteraceae bacterium]